MAPSNLGVHLFIPRREILQEVPKTNPVSRYRCLWQTTRGESSGRCDCARAVAQAGGILFQPPAIIGSASCRRLRSRVEAQTLRDSSHRRNRSDAAEPRKIARRSRSIQPVLAKGTS